MEEQVKKEENPVYNCAVYSLFEKPEQPSGQKQDGLSARERQAVFVQKMGDIIKYGSIMDILPYIVVQDATKPQNDPQNVHLRYNPKEKAMISVNAEIQKAYHTKDTILSKLDRVTGAILDGTDIHLAKRVNTFYGNIGPEVYFGKNIVLKTTYSAQYDTDPLLCAKRFAKQLKDMANKGELEFRTNQTYTCENKWIFNSGEKIPSNVVGNEVFIDQQIPTFADICIQRYAADGSVRYSENDYAGRLYEGGLKQHSPDEILCPARTQSTPTPLSFLMRKTETDTNVQNLSQKTRVKTV